MMKNILNEIGKISRKIFKGEKMSMRKVIEKMMRDEEEFHQTHESHSVLEKIRIKQNEKIYGKPADEVWEDLLDFADDVDNGKITPEDVIKGTVELYQPEE